MKEREQKLREEMEDQERFSYLYDQDYYSTFLNNSQQIKTSSQKSFENNSQCSSPLMK